MFDQKAVLIWVHRRNIERYGNLLKTNLNEGERRFVEELLAEEDAAMRRIGEAFAPGAKSFAPQQPCLA